MACKLGVSHIDFDGCMSSFGFFIPSSHPVVKAISDDASKAFALPNAVCRYGSVDHLKNRFSESANVDYMAPLVVARSNVCPSFMGSSMAIVVHA